MICEDYKYSHVAELGRVLLNAALCSGTHPAGLGPGVLLSSRFAKPLLSSVAVLPEQAPEKGAWLI